MADAAILPGAEPFSAAGGPHGALVLHGFTGTPQSMRGLAQAFADAGFAVELPLLPGHGTAVDEMLKTTWDDWSAAADAAYQDLATRTDRVVVAGLSMGGTLTVWLATRYPAIAGIVVVNPAIEPIDQGLLDGLSAMAEAGEDRFTGIGNDVADPDQTELAYAETPIAPLLSMSSALRDLKPELARVACPVLLCNSPQDHVVEPVSSEVLATAVSGPVERVTLERSYHVATLDFDRDLIESSAVAFAQRVTGG